MPSQRRAGGSIGFMGQGLVGAVSVAAQVAGVWVWLQWARRLGFHPTGAMAWLGSSWALFPIAAIVASLLHEVGHAFVGWGAYTKPLGFRAGPFQWSKQDDRWRFRFDVWGFGVASRVPSVVPTNPEQPRGHDLFMIAAGPGASLVWGVALLWSIHHLQWPHYAETWPLAAIVSTFCFVAAAVNLMPFATADGEGSDGACMWQILMRDRLYEYRRIVDAIASMQISGRRPRDLNLADLERTAERFADEVRGVELCLTAANVRLDAGLLADAAMALGRGEAICKENSLDLPTLLCASFVFAHTVTGNAEAARRWALRMGDRVPEDHRLDLLLALSALHCIEDRREEAELAWRRADAEAYGLPETGAGDFERERCLLLRQEMDKRWSAQSAQECIVAAVASEPAVATAPAEDAAPSLAAARTPSAASLVKASREAASRRRLSVPSSPTVFLRGGLDAVAGGSAPAVTAVADESAVSLPVPSSALPAPTGATLSRPSRSAGLAGDAPAPVRPRRVTLRVPPSPRVWPQPETDGKPRFDPLQLLRPQSADRAPR